MKGRLSDEQGKHYRLTLSSNGWYYSKNGLVLTDDEDVNERSYLSKVFKMNELADKFEEFKKNYDKI